MITDLERMKQGGGPKEVTLSGWDGEEITVLLRRPTLFNMAASGQIPNPLLPAAEALFMMNGSRITKNSLTDTAKALIEIARAALVKPTLEEMAEAGLELTDEQLNEIYAFVIGGAKRLETFRSKMRDPAGQHDAAAAQQGLDAAGH